VARRDSPRDARREVKRETKRETKREGPDGAREAKRDGGRDGARDGMRERRGARLDQPRDARRIPLRPHLEDDTFGRFAERFARFMGTARFLLYMSGFVALWLVYNWLAPGGSQFDPFPFIFLTLMLSLQASYAAPLILLAQNRQEDRDRVVAEGDRLANSRAHADMEFLAREMASIRMALGEVATRDYVRSELRSLLAEIGERLDTDDADGRDQPDPGQPGGRHDGHVG
jgi:uncharacterized membrane protein